MLYTKLALYFNEKLLGRNSRFNFKYNTIFGYYYFLKYYNIASKSSYLFNYILLKKQNSFLKKKLHLFNNFYSLTQKSAKLLKKKKKENENIHYFINLYKIKNKLAPDLYIPNMLELRKRLKKLLLENRKVIRNMLIPSIARSYKATRVISKFSKKKL
jgi:hypothetical protein